MSDLVKARVLEREGARLVLRLRLLPAEQGPFCTAPEFAWMLIDPSVNEEAFDALDAAALSACRSTKNAIDEENMARPDRVRLERALVRAVRVGDLRNYTEMRPRSAWEAAPDADAEEALYPEAVYTIELADPRLGAHLPVGFEWRCTACDEHDTGEFLPYP